MPGGGQLEGVEGLVGDEPESPAAKRSCRADNFWNNGNQLWNCFDLGVH